MRLAVYGPYRGTYPLVLVPECMMPSIQMGYCFGDLQLRGTIDVEESTLQAVSNPDVYDVTTKGLEYAVTNEFQASRIWDVLTQQTLSPVGSKIGEPVQVA